MDYFRKEGVLVCVSVSVSRSGRVQLWDRRCPARRPPLRLRRFRSHHLHRPALPQEEAEEEKSQRNGTIG